MAFSARFWYHGRMERIITYNIAPEDNGIKIQHYLRRRGYSRQSLIELKKWDGSVMVNGAPRRFNERLTGGDTLRIRIEEHGNTPVEPVHLPVGIVYEDADILVVNKPTGMPTHPSFQNTDNTLANALTWYYREKGQDFIFRCSNRLDRDTSGLTIVSKHYLSAAILSEMGTRHEIEREYLAIVHGHVTPPSGTIDAPLGRKDGSIIERCVDAEHGERAVTHYRVLRYLPPAQEHLPEGPLSEARSIREDEIVPCSPHVPSPPVSGDLPMQTGVTQEGCTLVSLRLETGRTHQIRVHMQFIGHPLLGDYLYDPDYDSEAPGPIARQALHAHRLRFVHPITGEQMDFQAPLPADMRAILPPEVPGLSDSPAG